MIAVKIECSCGQHYAFDVEPVNGRMPTSVVCPGCGGDGTNTANAIIAETLGTQPPPPARPAGPVFVRIDDPSSAPAPVGGIRLSTGASAAPPPAAKPPPIPQQPIIPRARVPVGAARKPKAGKDGWAKEETGLNKLGTYITVIPPILGAMLPWGIMGVELPLVPVCIVMVITGAIGGFINVMGRGPAVAGAVIGACISLGGYGASAWWLHGKESVQKFELLIAFAIGVTPGFLLQFGLQKFLQKRARATE